VGSDFLRCRRALRIEFLWLSLARFNAIRSRVDAFHWCGSLELVTFEANSALSEIREHAFEWEGWKSIVIRASVGVLDAGAFWNCKSLETVTFEAGSVLGEIG
jgi:hypothetical protein